MCFSINMDEQKPWKTRRVYKVFANQLILFLGQKAVRKGRFSPIYCGRDDKSIRLGSTLVARGFQTAPGVEEYEPTLPGYEKFGRLASRHGIYVVRTLKEARELRRDYDLTGGRPHIVECRVDPADFQYHSIDNREATYKRVKLVRVVK